MTTQHTKGATELKPVVYEIIRNHIGQTNAIKAGDIADRLGQSNDRLVREAVRQLRKDGKLILSSCKPPYGYYIAANPNEWVEFRDTNLKPRALDILQTSRAMGQAARIRFGQQMALFHPFQQN
jgi:hypothetical protein